MDPVLNYGRLANEFQHVSDVSFIATPGYARGEPLASGFDVLIGSLADAAVRCAEGRPFALCGISAGGMIANSVAAYLERTGGCPAALIMIDSFVLDQVPPRLSQFFNYQYATTPELGDVDFYKISASSVYTDMMRDWAPSPVAAPTLMVRPDRPVTGPEGMEPLKPEEWQARWPFDHVEIATPGDHFSLCISEVQTTAAVIRTWLAGLDSPGDVDPA
jgi:thioesterase domain-containing protein